MKSARPQPSAFPVVGIGASAGGLEAVRELFADLPPDTGMAFVFIQHLDPTHASSLPEILSRITQIPVVETSHDLRLKPDHIFVIPPNKDIQLSKETLHLSPRKRIGGLHLPIDTFLHSLAEGRKTAAIGVILSGTGSDGVLGLKAIKSKGGITFAQDSESARYASMPENAIVAGAVDFVLNPQRIAAELVKLAHFVGHPHPAGAEAGPAVGQAAKDKPLKEIVALLRSSTGVDFPKYNPNTIERRILRRMALSNIHNMAQYAENLRHNPSEMRSLYEDIFIHVTNFFRDSHRFEVLKSRIYPAIVKKKRPGESIRVWCAGCSTGEEAYSLAMTLLEYLSSKKAKTPIQIFATDISETAINKARAATYPTNIEAHVSPQRLKRFFVKQDTGYQISKQVRELCVFTKHDVTSDPPFSRLDLISCSNVLIYFGPPTQKEILSTFHYALKPAGVLMLGKSESVGRLLHLYESLDNKHKIYSRKAIATSNTQLAYSALSTQHVLNKGRERPETLFDLQREADQLVLAKYGHRGLLVDDKMRILQFRGALGRLLAPTSGDATLNLTAMLHPDLRIPIRVLIQKAGKQKQAVFNKHLPVKIDKISTQVSLEVIPITNRFDQKQFFLVLLEEYPRAKSSRTAPRKGAVTSADGSRKNRITELQQELGESREYLQLMIEQHEISNEKLDAANEELQSANEEMQSANEELETAKEELESSNEELNTLNEELQNRNSDLEQLNNRLAVTRDYAEAIIKTMREPFLVLDSALKVQSGNAAFYRAFHVDQSETVNRYVFDLGNGEWNIPELRRMLEDVLFKGAEFQDYEIERDFPGIGTRTLSLNALPISKKGSRADLILLAIGDITHLKLLEAAHDVIVREVHHRVKNNLQVISSLLSLQAHFVHDKDALEMFKATANRIRSIAFIHEKLHQTDQPATVDFKAYASDLANSLFGFHGLDAKKIALTMDIDDVSFHMDRAVPCGLILNELLTNAMKHAFPAGGKGNIRVELKEHRDGPRKKTRNYKLKVRDNGVGMSKTFHLGKTTSLGMKIIQLLTKQIGGTVEMHRNHGTSFQITFPK
jgi:two-component system CheB/CheR fusion protein